MGDWLMYMNGHELSYDNVGNPTEYVINGYYTQLDWNGRLLTGMNELDSAEFEHYYMYNDEGIRTSKWIDGTTYYYTLNGSQIVSQEWGDKLIIFFYDDLGMPIGYAYRTASMAADTFYYYVYEKNLQGDIVAVYNTSGTKLVSYTYDAWGNVSVSNINISGTNAGAQYNPFRYRGYYYDTETNLYYLNSRYYDPSTGRFLNADGYLNANGDLIGFNMFAYCSNNPVNRYDPTGHFWDYVFDAVFIVWGIVDVIDEPDNWRNWAALAIDLVFAVVPFITSGAGKIIKVANKVDNASDVASSINKIDNIYDTTKVTIIGRHMDRVEDTARMIGCADNLYDTWKGYDKWSSISKPFANAISAAHNGGWLFSKLRKGYTVIDIGVTTADVGLKAFGLWYGTERFVSGVWRTRNIWKIPINYYS